MALATALGAVPILAVLEGGYSPSALAANSRAFVAALLGVEVPVVTDLE